MLVSRSVFARCVLIGVCMNPCESEREGCVWCVCVHVLCLCTTVWVCVCVLHSASSLHLHLLRRLCVCVCVYICVCVFHLLQCVMTCLFDRRPTLSGLSVTVATGSQELIILSAGPSQSQSHTHTPNHMDKHTDKCRHIDTYVTHTQTHTHTHTDMLIEKCPHYRPVWGVCLLNKCVKYSHAHTRTLYETRSWCSHPLLSNTVLLNAF